MGCCKSVAGRGAASKYSEDRGLPDVQKDGDKSQSSGQKRDDNGPSAGQKDTAKELPPGQKIDDKGQLSGPKVNAKPAGPPEPLYFDSSPHLPGPLVEGEYIWKPGAPIRVFKAKFGALDWSDEAAFHEVTQLKFSHFLGSGAAGVVYKASYRSATGDTSLCAVKFAGALAHLKPDTHAAVDVLVQRDSVKPSPVYQAEKETSGLLRAENEIQWQKYTCGRVRMLQLIGFHNVSQALLLEYVGGSHPKPNPALMERVSDLLAQIAIDRQVEVTDVKYGNLIEDAKGDVTIIDFGSSKYIGKTPPNVCSQQIAIEIKSEADTKLPSPSKDSDEKAAHFVDGKLTWKTKDGKPPKVSDDFMDVSYEHNLLGADEDRCITLAEFDQDLGVH